MTVARTVALVRPARPTARAAPTAARRGHRRPTSSSSAPASPACGRRTTCSRPTRRSRCSSSRREVAGFGASGRNGGWCSALFPVSADALARRHGRGRGARDARGDARHRRRGRWRRRGRADRLRLRLRRHRHARPQPRRSSTGSRDEVAADARLGRRGAPARRRRRRASTCAPPGVLGGSWTPDCARVQPARLVRGLLDVVRAARRAHRRGHPRAAALAPRRRHRPRHRARPLGASARPRRGRATLPGRAARVAPGVLAHDRHRAAARRASGRRSASSRAQTFTDARHLIVYGQRTADDRLAFGGRGAPYHLGSTIGPRTTRSTPRPRTCERTLVDLFPCSTAPRSRTAGAARSPCRATGTRRSGSTPTTGIAWAGGYVGDGVATDEPRGRTLADLVTGADSPLVRLPWVDHRSPAWEPEPVRWAGITAARRADRVGGPHGGADRSREPAGRGCSARSSGTERVRARARISCARARAQTSAASTASRRQGVRRRAVVLVAAPARRSSRCRGTRSARSGTPRRTPRSPRCRPPGGSPTPRRPRGPAGRPRTRPRPAARTSTPSPASSRTAARRGTRSGQDSPSAMGSRMSGGDACASVEPSTNSTMECTTDCGCTTTVMSSTGTSNSRCASISSRPLFISVEELIVTTGPIDHVGCASACCGVTALTSSWDQPRNGPPEAVRINRRTSRVRAAAQRLRDGRVLGVDRHDLVGSLPRGVHQPAADDERLLVGEREGAARPQRGERRPQPDRACDAVEHDVGTAAGQLASTPARRRAPRPRAGRHAGAPPPVGSRPRRSTPPARAPAGPAARRPRRPPTDP